MPATASLAGAAFASDIIGNVFGSGSGDNHTEYNYWKALEFQPRIERANLLSRVQAMRDAGLHPAYAMGASAGGGSPAFSMSGQSPTGSFKDVGNSLYKYMQTREFASEKGLRKAELKNAELRNQRLALEIEHFKNKPPSNDEANDTADKVGKVEYVPAQVESQKSKTEPHVVAGVRPGWYQHRLAPGLMIQAPAQELSELFESPAMWPIVFSANKAAIGDWIKSQYSAAGAMGFDQFTPAGQRKLMSLWFGKTKPKRKKKKRFSKRQVSNQFYGYSRGPNR